MVLNWAKNQCTHWPRCIFVITAFTRNYDIASLIPRNQEADINHRVITSDACSLNHLHTRPLSHSLMHTFVLSLARLHTCAHASERERERESVYIHFLTPSLSHPLFHPCTHPHIHFPSLVCTLALKSIWTYFSGNIIQNLITRNDWIEWKCEYTWMWNWECEVYASVIEKWYIFRYDL